MSKEEHEEEDEGFSLGYLPRTRNPEYRRRMERFIKKMEEKRKHGS